VQKGIVEGREWLAENSCRTVALESTGKYWIPVFNLFEDHFDLTLANPKIKSALSSTISSALVRKLPGSN